MAKELSIEWPGLPPKEFSRNGSACHWSVLNRVRQEVADSMWFLLFEAGWDGATWERAKATVTFYLPTTGRYDHDNLTTAMKPLWDSLGPQRERNPVTGAIEIVQERLLKDDDLDTLGWPTYDHEYRKNRPGALIEIQEILG